MQSHKISNDQIKKYVPLIDKCLARYKRKLSHLPIDGDEMYCAALEGVYTELKKKGEAFTTDANGYYYRIIRNKMVDVLRKQFGRHFSKIDIPLDEKGIVKHSVSAAIKDTDATEREERRKQLAIAIANNPCKHIDALMLVMDGHTQRTIAGIFGVSNVSIHFWVNKGKKILQSSLEKGGARVVTAREKKIMLRAQRAQRAAEYAERARARKQTKAMKIGLAIKATLKENPRLTSTTLCSIEEMKLLLLEKALIETAGNITRASELVGVSIRTMRNFVSLVDTPLTRLIRESNARFAQKFTQEDAQ